MKFLPGELYHVYNRGNNSQPLFISRENYLYFLKKIRIGLLPFCDILAYCLMPNHYHLLIYTKDESSIDISENKLDPATNRLSRKIGTLQSSFTQAHNKMYKRTGSLFQQKAKNKHLNNSLYAFTCFHYIHQNPIKAGLCESMEKWEFSSFVDYLGLRKGKLPSYDLAYSLIDIPAEPEKFYTESLMVINNEELINIF
ncbi:MAG: transposase [Candidatus Cyclobacteriaceae bacterium M2_1C_046]